MAKKKQAATTLTIIFGQLLEARRIELKQSIEEVASVLTISEKELKSIEEGTLPTIDLETAYNIWKFYGVGFEQIEAALNVRRIKGALS